MANKKYEKTIIFKHPQTKAELLIENQRLLHELEIVYQSMEQILEESNKEKEIAYFELQKRFEAFENLYNELSKKENMLIHMEKLSSIGQFISELVHELRTPLHVISVQTQLSLINNLPDENTKQFQIIAESVDKMNNLIKHFSSMAYKGSEDFQIFNLNLIVAECLGTIEIIKPKRIKIETHLSEEKLMVKGDPYQLQQIFFNLAKNAFDAMKKQGTTLKVTTLKMSSESLRSKPEKAAVYCQTENKWNSILAKTSDFACAQFVDQGSGIVAEEMAKIFQPFYTTKEKGQGTGLGLSIASDIAIRHGGNLALSSILSQGTTFKLFLPLITG
jgi:signal transduction histidine kinase